MKAAIEETLESLTGLGEDTIVRVANEVGVTYREARYLLSLWEQAKLDKAGDDTRIPGL